MTKDPTGGPPGRETIRIVTITVSDTRTPSSDEGGAELGELLRAAGFTVSEHRIVPDEPERIRGALADIVERDLADVVVTTGGTGIAPRDVTIEVIEPLLDKRLDGFGEAFRRLSWDEVGPRAVLSRAVAGSYQGRLIAALPGSPRAVRLAVKELLIPLIEHAVALLAGRTTHAAHGPRTHS